MRIFYTILFLVIAIQTVCLAQVIVKGKVKSAEQQMPVEGVVISVLKPDSSTIVSYSLSDSRGEFRMQIENPQGQYLIKAAMLGFRTEIFSLSLSNTAYVNFHMVPKISILKEVIVTPPRIVAKKDTISYDVSSFSNLQDRSIGDVLKRMPGIDIQKDGTVLYNGKSINKFYIEGLDLLEGKYGLAINNVSHKDIKSVEVLEGHQPIKVLKNSMPTDRAAINLKLKDSSKAKLLGHIQAAGGVTPALWKADVLALKFSGTDQVLSLLQTNNIGENIKLQFKAHTLENYVNGQDNQYDQLTFVKVKAENAPIADQRSMFNKTYAFSTNKLYSLAKDYQVKANINLIMDHLDFEKHSVVKYYGPNDTENQIVENNIGASWQKQGMIDVNVKKNTSSTYLNNSLTGQLLWDNTNISTTGTSANTQRSRVPYHLLDNDFNLIKTYGKNRLSINSFNHFAFQPENLVFTTISSEVPVQQQAQHNEVISHTNISLSTGVSKWTIEYRAGLKATYQSLISNITSLNQDLPFRDSLENRSHLRSFDYYGSVSARFVNELYSLKIGLPIHNYSVQLNDALNTSFQHTNRTYLNPNILFIYKITPLMSFNVRAELSTKFLDIESAGEGYIFQTYRNLHSGSNQISTERRQNYTVGLSYRSPVNSFFSSISGSYNARLRGLTLQRTFEDYLLIERLFPMNNSNTNWNLSGRISKGFDEIGASGSISVSYQNSAAELLQNAQLLKSINNTINIIPKYSMTINDHLNFEYTGNLNYSNLNFSNRSSTGFLSNIQQTLSIGVIVSDKVNMKVNFDHMNNQLTLDQHISAFFADYKLQYIPSRRVVLDLSLNNLFNRRTIGYTVIGTASNTSSVYRIRPFNALLGLKISF